MGVCTARLQKCRWVIIQPGERLNGIQEVSGSIPLISTTPTVRSAFFFVLVVWESFGQTNNSGLIPLISTRTNRKVGVFLCFGCLRVFQANKQQRLDPAYLHQDQPKGWSFSLFESLSGKQTTAARSRLSPPGPTEWYIGLGSAESEIKSGRLPQKPPNINIIPHP